MSFAKSLKLSVLRTFASFGLRFQLVTLFVAVFGGLFALFSLGIYLYIVSVYQEEFDSALYNYVVDIGHSFPTESITDAEDLDDLLESSDMILPFSLSDLLIQIRDSKGAVLTRSERLQEVSFPPLTIDLDDLSRRHGYFADIELKGSLEGDRYRMVAHAFRREGGSLYLIEAAVPMRMLDVQRDGLFVFFSIAVPFIVALAAIAGMLFSRRAMAPVGSIISKANEIEAKRLSDRIPIPATKDEIRELVITLNRLLDRLERAFVSQEAFISDASHQLKTPLSILKGELQIFQQRTRSPKELGDFLTSAQQEIDSLSRIVEELLLLARVASDGPDRSGQHFRLDERLLDCVARFSTLAEAKGITFSLDLLSESGGDGSYDFEGDPELIRALIDNLLDNAIKYSPPNSVIAVSLAEGVESYRLVVRDNGAGIPTSALPHIFKRFYRDEAARSQVEGSGLGLAIVEKIARLYGGEVSAANAILPETGAILSVTFAKRQLTA